MQTVILAAGRGTRMGNLTQNTPKPLLKDGGITLIEHKLRNLPETISEVVIVVGYLGDKIRSQLGEIYGGRRITYVEQQELKGTAHALFICQPVLKDRFLVLMGDDLYKKEDLEEVIKYPLAILAWELPEESGGARWAELVRGERGELLDILEKRPSRKGMLVNTGAYSLDGRIFEYPPQPARNGTAELGLPQTILFMAKSGGEEVQIVKARWWKNITEPADLESGNGM
jgi:NDP-sugar pyrophosphorylase family protein